MKKDKCAELTTCDTPTVGTEEICRKADLTSGRLKISRTIEEKYTNFISMLYDVEDISRVKEEKLRNELLKMTIVEKKELLEKLFMAALDENQSAIIATLFIETMLDQNKDGQIVENTYSIAEDVIAADENAKDAEKESKSVEAVVQL